MKIALIGYGVVGQGLIEILRDKHAELQAQYGLNVQVVGVATRSRGTLIHPHGLDLHALTAPASVENLAHYPDSAGLVRDVGVLELLRASGAEVIVEVSPSQLETAQPALDYVRHALRNRQHVVLANKGPVAVALPELTALARANGVQLRYEATVMAGTPCFQLLEHGLRGLQIEAVRGILNGTTNYILTQMEGGMSYADALVQAQALGYAETDPTADVDGWDAAGKLRILGAVIFGKSLTFENLSVQGISQLTTQDIQDAQAHQERWKLVAQLTRQGGSVMPTRLPISHPLAGVSGATNAITFTADLLGDVTLVGAGAGKHVTGYGLLNDLLAIASAL